MRRNPIYVFRNLNSIGINKVPLESAVQINDADPQGNSLHIQVEAKNNVTPTTTIHEFLSDSDNYSTPSTALFVTEDQVGAPLGIAPLDDLRKIPGEYLPSMTMTRVDVVSSEQEMIDLESNEGDVAIRTDENKTYINNGSGTGTTLDWIELLTNPAAVQSVNGQTGNISLTADDVPEGLTNEYFTVAKFTNNIYNTKINELKDVDSTYDPVSGNVLIYNGTNYAPAMMTYPVSSVNGKTGALTLTTDDVSDNGQGNKYYDDALVDARLSLLVDDTAGLGDTNKIWSADKSANELTYKADSTWVQGLVDPKLDALNPIAQGFLDLSQNGSDVAKLRIKRTSADDATIIEPGSVVLNDVNNVKYSIKTDEAEAQLDFKVNEVTSMSIEEGESPITPHQPTQINSLTRKDYVDGEVDKKLDLLGGTLTGSLLVEGDVTSEGTLTTGVVASSGHSVIGFNYNHSSKQPAYIVLNNNNDVFEVVKESGTFEVFTSENNAAAAVDDIVIDGTETAATNAAKINELFANLRAAGLLKI